MQSNSQCSGKQTLICQPASVEAAAVSEMLINHIIGLLAISGNMALYKYHYSSPNPRGWGGGGGSETKLPVSVLETRAKHTNI